MMQLNAEQNNKISKETLILFMGLFYPAIHNYIWRVLVAVTGAMRLNFTIEIFDAIVWTIIIGYIILTSRNYTIKIETLVISLLFVLITLLCYMFTDYESFSGPVLFTLLIGTFSFFLQGSFINVKRVSHKHLYFSAIATLLISVAYSIYSINSKDLTLEDNMDFAYKVLPSVLIIISWLFTDQKKKLAIVLSIIGIIFLLLQGTRGPLFCLVFFVCLMLYKKRGLGKFFFKICFIILILAILVTPKFVEENLVDLADKIDASGYSSRFITMMVEGELTDGNGREAIQDTLLEDIKEEPFKIRGMFADRQATRGLVDREYATRYKTGTYAHNLLIEMIYDWGVVLGGAVLLFIFILVLELVKKCDKNDAYIAMLFVCIGFVYLFLSGSYLTSAGFFFLIGLAINYRKT